MLITAPFPLVFQQHRPVYLHGALQHNAVILTQLRLGGMKCSHKTSRRVVFSVVFPYLVVEFKAVEQTCVLTHGFLSVYSDAMARKASPLTGGAVDVSFPGVPLSKGRSSVQPASKSGMASALRFECFGLLAAKDAPCRCQPVTPPPGDKGNDTSGSSQGRPDLGMLPTATVFPPCIGVLHHNVMTSFRNVLHRITRQ